MAKIYGKIRDVASEGKKAEELKAFLKEKGIKLDSKYWSQYVNAFAYGGYSKEDIANDLYARSKGKEGNVSPTQNRKDFYKAKPYLFTSIDKRPNTGVTPKSGSTGTSNGGASSYGDWLKSTGKLNQKGQLPQQDSMGRWRWINEDGSVFEQEGFSLAEGEDGWGYLGEHDPDQWTSAQEIFKTNTLKDLQSEFNDLSSLQKKEYIDKAHKELSQNFMLGLAQGQSDTISDLGTALSVYADNMKLEDQALDADVQSTIDAMEESGLTFTGRAREQLGDAFSAQEFLSPADRAKLLDNMQKLKAIRSGAIGAGGGIDTDIAMPRPAGIDEANNPATGKPWTDAEKNSAWDTMFKTPEWTAWQTKIEEKTAMDKNPSEMIGLAGQGTYGVQQQLNRMAGTRGFEGKVLQRNRQIQESSRSNFGNQVKNIITPFERMYGSAGMAGLSGPTIGGQSIYGGLAGNVFGSAQGGYQTNVGTNVGNQAGAAVDQWAPTLNSNSWFN